MLHDFHKEKLAHLFSIIDYDHNGLIQESDFVGMADNIEIFTGLVYQKKNAVSLVDDCKRIWRSIRSYFKSEELQHISLEQWLEYIDAHFFTAQPEAIYNNVKYLVSRIHQVFDRDKDVMISKLEFMSIFVSCRVEIRHANKCFEAIDLNSDGFISYKELEIAADQFFHSTEPDASGNRLFGELGSTHFKLKRNFL